MLEQKNANLIKMNRKYMTHYVQFDLLSLTFKSVKLNNAYFH